MSDINEKQAKDFKVRRFEVERVANGFMLELDKRQQQGCAIDTDCVYVFNTAEELGEFIKNLK